MEPRTQSLDTTSPYIEGLMNLHAGQPYSSEGVDWALWDLAFKYTNEALTAYGNRVSDAHATALWHLIGSCVHIIALPDQKRRLVSDLPCGAGKTTAIRALIRAIHELDRPYRVVVCAEKIEGLCELKRQLLTDAVPSDRISLLHSYKHSPYYNSEGSFAGIASEPADSDDLNDLRQFVLMSHSKLHQGFNDMSYELMLYDEALILGEGGSIEAGNLIRDLGGYTSKIASRFFQATHEQKVLSDWVSDVRSLLEEAEDSSAFVLPELPIEIKRARQVIQAAMGDNKLLLDALRLGHEQDELRLLLNQSQGSALIHTRQSIPNKLRNIVVLDASYGIRKLMEFDKTFSLIPQADEIKQHNNVTVHTTKAKAGRRKVMSGLASGGDDPLFHEVAELTADKLRDGRKILLITFKDDGNRRPARRHRELIQHYLGDLDLNNLATGGELNFLTWGYETALNNYSHCDVVIIASPLTLPHAAVAGRVFAHAQDMNIDLSSETLNEVVQSEKVHSLYQALSRGSCRIMINGEAQKMDAYIFTHDVQAMQDGLKAIMPGVRFAAYEPKHLKQKLSKKEECKSQILAKLNAAEGDKISIKEVYSDIPEVSRDTKQAAMDELLATVVPFEWKRDQGRSLVRIT